MTEPRRPAAQEADLLADLDPAGFAAFEADFAAAIVAEPFTPAELTELAETRSRAELLALIAEAAAAAEKRIAASTPAQIAVANKLVRRWERWSPPSRTSSRARA